MVERLVRVGVREFREDLAGYLDSAVPVAITRHGQTVGYYVPAARKPGDQELLALSHAVEQLQALMAAHGISEDEVVLEFRARHAPS